MTLWHRRWNSLHDLLKEDQNTLYTHSRNLQPRAQVDSMPQAEGVVHRRFRRRALEDLPQFACIEIGLGRRQVSSQRLSKSIAVEAEQAWGEVAARSPFAAAMQDLGRQQVRECAPNDHSRPTVMDFLFARKRDAEFDQALVEEGMSRLDAEGRAHLVGVLQRADDDTVRDLLAVKRARCAQRSFVAFELIDAPH